MTVDRRKLIEVSLPLDAINRASAREKSIRHGHPSTLHLWWARRPLAACRAVLFAQLVDDPSAWPEEFPTEEDQARERARLHAVIAEMLPWKATNDPRILNKARFEIARSLARARGETPPPPDDAEAVSGYLRQYAPPVCDPFCGGGSIPLEAQRLGLRAYGSDLNPVAVLVSKATCEIPPKFAGRPPVNPERDPLGVWRGAQGLAEDIRHYGRWMRVEAERRIGHLYPKVEVTEAAARNRADLRPHVGRKLTVIAWLWARTVASPDPMVRGAHVPLVSSFMLSTKKGKQAWVEVEQDTAARDGWRFVVKTGNLDKDEEARKKLGTKAGKAQDFLCVLTGTPVPRPYIQAEGKADRLSKRLMAVVAEAPRGRLYVTPTPADERIADTDEFDEARLDLTGRLSGRCHSDTRDDHGWRLFGLWTENLGASLHRPPDRGSDDILGPGLGSAREGEARFPERASGCAGPPARMRAGRPRTRTTISPLPRVEPAPKPTPMPSRRIWDWHWTGQLIGVPRSVHGTRVQRWKR